MKKEQLVKNDFLIVSNAGHKGRGVFTSKVLKKGDLIELCPVIELTHKEHQQLVGHILENYTFVWNSRKKSVALLLGFGSLYNHSKKSNADYNINLETGMMEFTALKTIKIGEEITIDYGDMHADLN